MAATGACSAHAKSRAAQQQASNSWSKEALGQHTAGDQSLSRMPECCNLFAHLTCVREGATSMHCHNSQLPLLCNQLASELVQGLRHILRAWAKS
jgi:hypothetical protein